MWVVPKNCTSIEPDNLAVAQKIMATVSLSVPFRHARVGFGVHDLTRRNVNETKRINAISPLKEYTVGHTRWRQMDEE